MTTPALSGRLVFLMTLNCALAVSTVYYHQPLLPQMASSFGVTLARGSLVATLTQLGYATGLLFFVPLGDTLQPRRLASMAIVANAIALLACALAPTFSLLAAFSFVVGMTAITAQIIIPAVSGRAAPQARGRVVGTLLGGLTSGLLLARTLSGFVGAHLGWRAIFVLASAVDLVLLAIVLRHLPESTGLTSMRYRDLMRSVGRLVREERLLRIAAMTGLLMFAAISALWSTIAALLSRPPYGLGPATIGAFGLVGLVGIPSSPRIGTIVDRVGARTMVLVGSITIAAAFGFIAAGALSLVWLVVGMVLIDLGNRAGFVANQSRIFGLRQDARSRLNTVFMVANFLGGAAGAALGGLAAQHHAWIGLALVGSALALAAMAVNLLAATHRA
ncbi:MFS transporter [Piscinibacter sp. XHJ-5]|uniref:MFS transporter n=1 Tax=Piscinibacter sp. XHJ-5 TaxID=3037797 RepID=UPI00245355B0|nr:MFS transporter [Piscinibacter sp. XHJ-5]